MRKMGTDGSKCRRTFFQHDLLAVWLTQPKLEPTKVMLIQWWGYKYESVMNEFSVAMRRGEGNLDKATVYDKLDSINCHTGLYGAEMRTNGLKVSILHTSAIFVAMIIFRVPLSAGSKTFS